MKIVNFFLKLPIVLVIVTSSWTNVSAKEFNSKVSSVNLVSPPNIQIDKLKEISSGFWLIPDPYINYVPNIGIIEGKKAILVIDTGMGMKNGSSVYNVAKKIAKNREIYLTSTHFHPEHQFGAMEFKDTTLILNQRQQDELIEKGQQYLKMFKAFGKIEQDALQDVVLRFADKTYNKKTVLDLGDRLITLQETPAHTRGDQIIFDQTSGAVFMGDLYEKNFYPIMPDQDAKGSQWIEVMNLVINMKPKIVVPGHGDISTINDLKEFRHHMLRVKNLTKQQLDLGLNQNQITKKISPTIKAEYPNWKNSVFLPFEIANFYAELSNKSIVLPSLVEELQSDIKK